MKKMLMGVMIAGLLAGCGKKEETGAKTEDDRVKIGITQIVEHPSLDEIRRGVEDAVKDSEFGERVVFEFQNAQGDFATAQTIAEQFGKGTDMMVAITTPSAQAAQNKISDNPVFFTGVTNPVEAGLSGENVTGVSDMSPVDAQADLIVDILPEVRVVGTIYNTSEANSVFLTDEFTKAAEERGMEVVARGITSVNEAAAAMDTLKGVDAIYTTKDNMVASAYSLIVAKADEAGIPVIGATTDFTEMGALASAGTSEYAAGYQTGEMIVRYLEGTEIKDMPVEYIEDIELTLNGEKAAIYSVDKEEFQKMGGKILD